MEINKRKFYRQVFALVIPMALQNLINVGVTAADVLMLGRVSEKVLSGASLAGQIQFVMTLILFGTTSGATVLTAQYWGKKDTQTIEKILGMGMTIGVSCAALFTIVAEIIPEVLLHIYTSDPAVIAEGVKYFRIVALSYVLMAATQVYLYIMRSIEQVVIATVVYSASLICNVLVNALLIFGLFGLPKMGIMGAAIGTLTARIVELIIVIWYAKVKNHDVRFHPVYMRKIDKVLLKDFLIYASPVILNEMMWGLGSTANTAVIGHLGSAAVAANSVAQVARQLATVVAFGVSNATAIYLGKTIGAKEFHLAKEYGKRFFVAEYYYRCGRRRHHSDSCSDCKSCDDTLTGSAGVSLFYVFCYVLLYTLPGDQYDPCGGCIPGRRRYQVWSDPGCVYHVGMLYSAGYDRCLCLSCAGAGCLYPSDE